MPDPILATHQLDPTAACAVRHAVESSGSIEQLSVRHLVVGLLRADGGFVLRKLRRTHVDRVGLVRQAYVDAPAKEVADPTGVVKTVRLAAALTSANACINTQHLFAAIVLDDSNCVSKCLTKAGIDRPLFVSRHFPYLRDANHALEALRCAGDAVEMQAARGVLAQALLPSHTQPPTSMPPRAPVQPPPARCETPAAELTARRWLHKLLSRQAERYDADGFVEVRSTLIPSRSYRIYRDGCMTRVYEAGRVVARSCLKLRSSSLPPTDRVIAEYFLIRGDEDTYLTTANIARC